MKNNAAYTALLQKLHQIVNDSLKNGDDFAEFQKRFSQELSAHWTAFLLSTTLSVPVGFECKTKSHSITPTEKLALANELIEFVNRYCEENNIADYEATSVLLLAYAATKYTTTPNLELG